MGKMDDIVPAPTSVIVVNTAVIQAAVDCNQLTPVVREYQGARTNEHQEAHPGQHGTHLSPRFIVQRDWSRFGQAHGIVAHAAAVFVGLDPAASRYYLESSVPEAFGRNVVNVILVDFRALDTLGEVSEQRLAEDEGPFLKEEVRLIHSLADRLGHWLLFRKLKSMGRKWRELGDDEDASPGRSWRVLVELLKETAEAVSNQLHLDSLFQMVAERARELIQAATAAGVSHQVAPRPTSARTCRASRSGS